MKVINPSNLTIKSFGMSRSHSQVMLNFQSKVKQHKNHTNQIHRGRPLSQATNLDFLFKERTRRIYYGFLGMFYSDCGRCHIIWTAENTRFHNKNFVRSEADRKFTNLTRLKYRLIPLRNQSI